MNAPDRVRVERDAGGDWYWSRSDGNNGEKLSTSSESYESRSWAIRQAFELNADIDVVEVLDPDGLLDVISRSEREAR